MKKSNTLVMVVNYVGAEKYAEDYFNSIFNQDTNKFDLLILNDNTSSIYLESNINVYEIIISDKKDPSMIRLEGIRYAIDNNYRNLIFSDIDDYFSHNRISTSIRELNNNEFVFNELSLINFDGSLIQKKYIEKLSLNKNTYSYKQILDLNYLGLTHTGVNLKLLKKFNIPKGIIAVDWWIFTIILLKGSCGKYINNATTYYRQSNENFVGINKMLNEDRLKIGISVKKAHYKHTVEYCKKNNLEKAMKDYIIKFEEVIELELSIKDREFQKKYIDVINPLMDKIYCGWWSEILDLKTWRAYAN